MDHRAHSVPILPSNDVRRSACRRPRFGFTLIEMLVVIVVVAILAGLIFRMIGVVTRQADKTKTIAIIQSTANAVEGFYAEYGQYPPVPVYPEVWGRWVNEHGNVVSDQRSIQPVRYEFPHPNGMPSHVAGAIQANTPWSQAPVFTYGLMAFLVPRYSGRAERAKQTYQDILKNDQWSRYNVSEGDQERDLAAMKSWEPHIDRLTSGHWVGRSLDGRAYTNSYVSIRDAWNHELRYESPPPHQVYHVWSVGPDGIDGNDDDVQREGWEN